MSDSDLSKDLKATRRAARDTAEAASETLRDAAGSLRARAHGAVDSAAEIAASATAQADEALHVARDLLSEASSRLSARLNDRMAAVAESRPAHQANEVWTAVRENARRNPGLYMAGAAVAGFVIARMFTGRGRG